MKKNHRKLIGVVILIVILLILLNPDLLFFLSSSVRSEIKAEIANTFGSSLSTSIILSVPKLISLIIMIIGLFLVTYLIRWLLSRSQKQTPHQKTIAGLLSSIIKYAAVIIAIVWGLSILGVNVTAILASLGIIGLIIGFGAQSLIEDIITGIFIIFEGSYEVGDIIILDDFRGTVKNIEVRTTTIEDDGGNFKIVNNSDIRNFQNRSRCDSYAVCDIKIPYDVDPQEVVKVLTPAYKKMMEKYPGLFTEVPSDNGVQSFTDTGYVIRCWGIVKENLVFKATRILNEETMMALKEKGINIPSISPLLNKLNH